MKKALLIALTGLASASAVGFAAPAHADRFSVCPSGMSVVATEDTSCAFADNVRYSWYAQPGSIVTALSQVTQKTYTMQ